MSRIGRLHRQVLQARAYARGIWWYGVYTAPGVDLAMQISNLAARSNAYCNIIHQPIHQTVVSIATSDLTNAHPRPEWDGADANKQRCPSFC